MAIIRMVLVLCICSLGLRRTLVQATQLCLRGRNGTKTANCSGEERICVHNLTYWYMETNQTMESCPEDIGLLMNITTGFDNNSGEYVHFSNCSGQCQCTLAFANSTASEIQINATGSQVYVFVVEYSCISGGENDSDTTPTSPSPTPPLVTSNGTALTPGSEPQGNNASVIVGVVVAVLIAGVIALSIFIYCRWKIQNKAPKENFTLQNGVTRLDWRGENGHENGPVLDLASSMIDDDNCNSYIAFGEIIVLRKTSAEKSRGNGSLSLSVLSTDSAVIYSDVNSTEDRADSCTGVGSAHLVSSLMEDGEADDGDVGYQPIDTQHPSQSEIKQSDAEYYQPVESNVHSKGIIVLRKTSAKKNRGNGSLSLSVLSTDSAVIYSDINSTEDRADRCTGVVSTQSVSSRMEDGEVDDGDVGYQPIDTQHSSQSKIKQSDAEYYQQVEPNVHSKDSVVDMGNADVDFGEDMYQAIDLRHLDKGDSEPGVQETGGKEEYYQTVDSGTDTTMKNNSVVDIEEDYYQSVDTKIDAPEGMAHFVLGNRMSRGQEHYEAVGVKIHEVQPNSPNLMSATGRNGELVPVYSVVDKRKHHDDGEAEENNVDTNCDPSRNSHIPSKLEISETVDDDYYNLRHLNENNSSSDTEVERKSELVGVYSIVKKRKESSDHETVKTDVDGYSESPEGGAVEEDDGDEENGGEDVFQDGQMSSSENESVNPDYDHLRVRTLSHGHQPPKYEETDMNDDYYNHLSLNQGGEDDSHISDDSDISVVSPNSEISARIDSTVDISLSETADL